MTDTTDAPGWPASPAAAFQFDQEMTAPELTRRLTHILARAADTVGVEYPSDCCFHPEGLAQEVLAAAQGKGALRPTDYRRVYSIHSVLRRTRLEREGGMTSAEAGA